MHSLLRHSGLVALIAGLASATGFAPLDLWPVLIGCFAIWLWLVHAAPTQRAAMWRSWLFGAGHFTVGNNWIQHAFDYQEKMPPVLGYFAVVLLALYLAVYPMMAGALAWRFGRTGDRPGGSFAMIAAAAWIVTEWLRATMFTGYAWNPVGVAWLPLIPVARAAAWIGTYAMSGVAVLVAASVVMLAHRRWKLPAGLAAMLGVVALVNAGSSALPPSPSDPLVRVVQPNIGQEAVGDPNYAERLFTTQLDLSGTPGPRPRLIVWPEGTIEYRIEDGYPPDWYYRANAPVTRARIASRLGPADQALVGANALFFDGDGRIAGAGNAIFTIGPDARLGPVRYDKAHLVPYGEYLPMRTLLAPLGLARLVMGEIDFVPGPGPQTVTVPGFGKVGMQICYEIIFSGEVVDAANRPAILVNPSYDAWFGTWGPPQHLAQARMRAIEEGIPVLRPTPTGISAVVAADGVLLASIPAGRAGAIELPMPHALPPTLFSRIGNLMAFIVAALFVTVGVAFRRFSR